MAPPLTMPAAVFEGRVGTTLIEQLTGSGGDARRAGTPPARTAFRDLLDAVDAAGVDRRAGRFVLPLGATINMDGTGLYQGVAAVFIATICNIDLTLGDQLTIVLTASLASIGTAAVPGVGLIMLTIVLVQINVPPTMDSRSSHSSAR